MKKSLLSILAGALLVVGCQNYDDQFDSLESQINALASTVAGLSQVQSDLASLAGTVASIQSSIDSSVQTALASGLSDIDAAIETLNQAATDAANNSDIASISEEVDNIAADLDTLLASAAVFNGDVTINTVSTLDVFHQMGDAIAIVNGNVDIDATSDMDATKLQETIDQILTTVKDFSYEAGSSTALAPTFNNLTGTRSLTVKTPGDIRFEGLVSASNIFLKDDYKSKTKVIHFGKLTSVQKFHTDATANRIAFNKATELHLTELEYYPPLDLTVVLDEGAAFPNKIDDRDADGDQKDITLNITGPASVSFTNILDGSMTFEDVASVTVNGYKGTFDINAGVESFSADKVTVIDLAGASDLETLDITGSLDEDNTSDKSGPSITVTSNNNLATVDIDGNTAGITLTGNGNLETVTIGAVVDGSIAIGASGNGNTDLTTLTLTGASATGVDVIGNTDIETVTIDATMIAGTGASAVVDGNIKVMDNTSLTNLNISSNNVEYLKITGNDDLTTVNFEGLSAAGATGSPEVYIYNNDITGAMEDLEDGNTDVANGKSGDLGTITSESGIATLKTYLAAVAADEDSTAEVFFDAVDFTTEGDTTSEFLWTTDAATTSEYARILYVVPNTADKGDAVTTAKRSFLLTPAASALGLVVNNVDILETGVSEPQTPATSTSLTLSTNSAISKNQILDTATLALADIAGVTIDVVEGGSAVSYVGFGANTTAGENSAATVGSFMMLNASDSVKVEIDGLSVTVSGTQTDFSTGFSAANILSLIENITEEWRKAYVVGTVKSATAVKWDLTSVADAFGGALTSPTRTLKFIAKDHGTPAIGVTPAVTITSGKTATHTNLGYIIGNDVSKTNSAGDNGAKGTDLVLTLTADTAGATLSEIGSPLAAASIAAKGVALTYAGTDSELNSTFKPNSAASAVSTALNIYPHESRTDVIVPEEANAAAASNATNYSRVGWFN